VLAQTVLTISNRTYYQEQCEDLAAQAAHLDFALAPSGLRKEKEDGPMEAREIHDYARRFVGAHGDKAELEAAQKAAECERQGQRAQAIDWRRIQAAIKEMRGPHSS
jgi:hypothetical protein